MNIIMTILVQEEMQKTKNKRISSSFVEFLEKEWHVVIVENCEMINYSI